MKKLFGTDGIRGKAGEFPLDRKTISIIGRSLSNHLKAENGSAPRFVIGRDTRESCNWIERAFCSGAIAEGAKCESAGVITTPGVAYLAKSGGFDVGIVISASHNPFEDNGLKVFLPTGKKLGRETEALIEADIFNDKFGAAVENSEVELGSKTDEFHQAYLDYLESEFKNLSLANLTLVVDCANGAASEFAPKLFEDFGANVITINNSPDGTNINKDCGSLHLDKLQQKVIEAKADFGVAFDGDADRSLFVDDKGELVDGDATLWVMAQHLQNEAILKEDTVVATVMSNIGLQVALDSRNIKLLRTPVGDKYVLQELLNSGASVGGEQSGHIIFPHRSLVGDGMQTALFLLEALQENEKSLSEMRIGFTQFPQILVNVKVAEKKPFDEVEQIVESSKQIENELGESGRLLLRYSGTENLARVMIEGADQTQIEEQANKLASVIETSLG